MKTNLVVIGGGAVGLGIAFYAAEKGLPSLVLEGGYLGSGSTGRSFGLVKERLDDEAVSKLASVGLKAHENLSSKLGINTLFRQDGCLMFASTEEELQDLEKSHETHVRKGISCKWVSPGTISSLAPLVDANKVLGGCFHRREGLVHSPTLLWGFYERIRSMGCTVKSFTSASKITVDKNSVRGIESSDGEYIETGNVVVASGITTGNLLRDIGLNLPLEPLLKEMSVTEPMRSLLNPVLERPSTGFRLGQTMRGEIIGTTGFTPNQNDLSKHSLKFVTNFSRQVVELLPSFSSLKVMRQWTGVLDATPDDRPVVGETDIEGLYVSCGFREYGITIAPAIAKMVADLICEGELHSLLKPFNPGRFH